MRAIFQLVCFHYLSSLYTATPARRVSRYAGALMRPVSILMGNMIRRDIKFYLTTARIFASACYRATPFISCCHYSLLPGNAANKPASADKRLAAMRRMPVITRNDATGHVYSSSYVSMTRIEIVY